MGNLVATCDYKTGIVGWYGEYYSKYHGMWKRINKDIVIKRGVLKR